MAALDAMEKLAALEETRSRLEAALASDENWRALRHVRSGQAADRSAERRARDTRLEMALDANPLYRAWQHVNDAIAALGEGGQEAQRVSEPRSIDREPVAQASETGDNLLRIRGVSPALAQRLSELGITHYRQIADWRAQDVQKYSVALGLKREINRQNWIEQAALLAGGVRAARPEHPEHPEHPGPYMPPAEEAEQHVDVLPEEIVRLIRAGAVASDAAIPAGPSASDLDAEAHAEPVVEPVAEAVVEFVVQSPPPAAIVPAPMQADPAPAARIVAIPTVEPLASVARVEVVDVESIEIIEIRPHERSEPEPEQAPPRPAPELAAVVQHDGGQHNGGSPAREPKAGPEPEPGFAHVAGSGEASVTFVVRKPRPSLLPAADMPADLGTERKSALFERLRGVKEGAQPDAPGEVFAAANAADEAEVVIVDRTGDKGTVQRFLKTLSGD